MRPGRGEVATRRGPVSARMPYFCVPRYVDIVDDIPKTVIRRVRKDQLRARGVSPSAWDRETHGYIVSR
jgi:crotonobetaine/carnitine-CoA ligase